MIANNIKIMLCQVNPSVGDLKGNLVLIKSRIQESVAAGYDVVVFPELVTVGCPPRNLLRSQQLWKSHDVLVKNLHQFIQQQKRCLTVILGGLHQTENSHGRVAKYNAAYIIDKQSIRHVHKRVLSRYDTINEDRHFDSGVNDPYLPIPIVYGNDDNVSTINVDVIIG